MWLLLGVRPLVSRQRRALPEAAAALAARVGPLARVRAPVRRQVDFMSQPWKWHLSLPRTFHDLNSAHGSTKLRRKLGNVVQLCAWEERETGLASPLVSLSRLYEE